MAGHRQRVGTMAWSAHHLATGGRDRTILLRDVRQPENYNQKFNGHKSEASCCLKLLGCVSLVRELHIRMHHRIIDAAACHQAQVCGLKWSPDDRELASGGNDNHLNVWNMHSASPVVRFTDHVAAVKAIAWSPHQHGLLASGGGTADRCIKFWNTSSGQALQSIDTGV